MRCLAYWLACLLCTVGALSARAADAPKERLLFDFEEPSQAEAWQPLDSRAKVEVSGDVVRHGLRALRITLKPDAENPGPISLRVQLPQADWGSYQALQFDIYCTQVLYGRNEIQAIKVGEGAGRPWLAGVNVVDPEQWTTVSLPFPKPITGNPGQMEVAFSPAWTDEFAGQSVDVYIDEVKLTPRATESAAWTEVALPDAAVRADPTNDEQASGYQLFQPASGEALTSQSAPQVGEIVTRVESFAAPGETASACFAVYALKDLRLDAPTLEPLKTDDGRELGEHAVQVHTLQSVAEPVATGEFAAYLSALVAPSAQSLSAGKTAAYTLEFDVPADAKPGAYHGMLKIPLVGDKAISVPVDLRVVAATLPEAPVKCGFLSPDFAPPTGSHLASVQVLDSVPWKTGGESSGTVDVTPFASGDRRVPKIWSGCRLLFAPDAEGKTLADTVVHAVVRQIVAAAPATLMAPGGIGAGEAMTDETVDDRLRRVRQVPNVRTLIYLSAPTEERINHFAPLVDAYVVSADELTVDTVNLIHDLKKELWVVVTPDLRRPASIRAWMGAMALRYRIDGVLWKVAPASDLKTAPPAFVPTACLTGGVDEHLVPLTAWLNLRDGIEDARWAAAAPLVKATGAASTPPAAAPPEQMSFLSRFDVPGGSDDALIVPAADGVAAADYDHWRWTMAARFEQPAPEVKTKRPAAASDAGIRGEAKR